MADDSNAEPIVSSTSVDALDLQSAANEAEQVSTVDSDSVAVLVPGKNGGQIWSKWPPHAAQNRPESPVARLRDAMRAGLERVLPGIIEDIASGKLSKLQGADLLAKYGIGATGTVTIVSPDVIARLEKQATAIAARPQWDTVELLQILRDIWT